ncbi:AB hydrolase-1 domain-containing protein [Mycena venus]|uniref:AB hydrolase-1 domain-containing protein n=1 Tax=Mycena venus TaxID=2733690 RepID=A0A8H6TU11_9AGAR|nr:AB hydrolase-1 domain-containing protein [Mycena venus]
MSAATKPTIIIIPASLLPALFGIELETVGRREKAPSMYDDAAVLSSLATKLADEGKDIVLVAHSYGGVVACEGAKGLAQSVREKESKQGGIVRIVFVSAVVPGEGQGMLEIFEGVTMDTVPIRVELKGEYLEMDTESGARGGYSDMPLEEALSWASRMREHAATSYQQKLTYAAYKDIPVSYLFCEEDKGVIPEAQNKIIAGMESVMGGRTVDRHSVKAGHHINASQPGTMAAVVRKALA